MNSHNSYKLQINFAKQILVKIIGVYISRDAKCKVKYHE